MATNRFTLGNVEIISISDASPQMQAASVFPNVTAEQWSKYPDAVSADGKMAGNFGVFVLRSGGQNILVDTGIGPGFPGTLPDKLRENGLNPGDINIVALTHLHGDHIGWNIAEDGKPRFTNAKYLVPKADWDFFTTPDQLERFAAVKAQAFPLRELGVLEIIDEGANLTDEVTAISTPGHTPGHTSYAISSQGERGLVLGDIVNFPFQVQETDWQLAFDNDSAQARKTREALMERLESEGSLAAVGHFPVPGLGRFLRGEGRRYWQAL